VNPDHYFGSGIIDRIKSYPKEIIQIPKYQFMVTGSNGRSTPISRGKFVKAGNFRADATMKISVDAYAMLKQEFDRIALND